MTALATTASWHYLGVLFACVTLTLPLELVLGARVYRRPLRLAATLAITAVPFIGTDWWAVRAGLWGFSPRYTLGVTLLNLPIEELLFFVVVPVCAVLTYSVVCNRSRRRR